MSKNKETETQKRIKAIRQMTGLTREAFYEKYHIPAETISAWERGKRECPLYVVELLEFRVRSDYEQEDKSE